VQSYSPLQAAIFAAILTAFIIESKKLLEQGSGSAMVDAMIFYTNSVANGTHEQYIRPKFEPPSFAVTVNCFFASLSGRLAAALSSVVALQWVADYDAAITRGGSSPEDRVKRRQFRHAGVVWWKMSEVIAALPLLIHSSVVLFLFGLILWMLAVHRIVGGIIVGRTALTILFYLASTLIAVVCAFSNATHTGDLLAVTSLKTDVHSAFAVDVTLLNSIRIKGAYLSGVLRLSCLWLFDKLCLFGRTSCELDECVSLDIQAAFDSIKFLELYLLTLICNVIRYEFRENSPTSQQVVIVLKRYWGF